MATMFQIIQFFDGNGDPLSGGKVYWYQAGTLIPKDTYIDEAESGTAENPVILDSEGRPDHGSGAAAMWITGSYKMIPTNSSDVAITTIDNINEYDMYDFTGLTATISDLNSTTTTTVTKTSSYTTVEGDRGKTILADATSGAFYINLLSAATAGDKYKIVIKKTDTTTNVVTIDPSGAQLADGRSTMGLYDYNDFVELHCDGSNWHRVSSLIRGTVYEITADTTLDADNEGQLVVCDASGGAIALTLPAAATVCSGWKVGAKKTNAGANNITITPSAGETIDGAANKALVSQYETFWLISDGSNWNLYAETISSATKEYPPGYIYGLTLSNDAGDTDHDIAIAVGGCRDTGDAFNIDLTSAITKRIDANWSAGTNQGGFPTALGLTHSTWYHVFVIATTGGVVDAGFDTSLTAHHLLHDASTYTHYKRVGSVYTDGSSNITQFYMYSSFGMRVTSFNEPIADFVGATVAADTAQTVLTPTGVAVWSLLRCTLNDSTGSSNYCNIYSPNETSAAPASGASPGSMLSIITGGIQSAEFEVLTDTSSNVQHRSDNTASILTIVTRGWKE